jgi:hypothetical protein
VPPEDLKKLGELAHWKGPAHEEKGDEADE